MLWKHFFHTVENFCPKTLRQPDFFHTVEIIFP